MSAIVTTNKCPFISIVPEEGTDNSKPSQIKTNLSAWLDTARGKRENVFNLGELMLQTATSARNEKLNSLTQLGMTTNVW